MQGDSLQSLRPFSSWIDTSYLAPMQLESPSWVNFPSFVEEAKSMVQNGEIRTVTDLDNFMYHKVSPALEHFKHKLTLSV